MEVITGSSQHVTNTVATASASTPSPITPSATVKQLSTDAIRKSEATRRVAEGKAKKATKSQQDITHLSRNKHLGKLPVVTVSPAMIGYDENVVNAFLHRAYPGCLMKINEDASDKRGDVLGYDVTEPDGHKVCAIFEFVPNNKNYSGNLLHEQGHYYITEQPYLTPEQQASLTPAQQRAREQALEDKQAKAETGQDKKNARQAGKQASEKFASSRQQKGDEEVYTRIKARLARDYPTSYVTQKMLFDSNVEAYQYMKTMRDTGLKAKLEEDYPDNYITQKTLYDANMKAKQDLGK